MVHKSSLSNLAKLRALFLKTNFSSREQYVRRLHKCIKNLDKKMVITANPETFMIALRDDEFYAITQKDYVDIVPDGIGVIKGADLLKYKTNGRNTGIELTLDLLKYASDHSLRVVVYGSRVKVIDSLKDVFTTKYPGIKKVEFFDGYTTNLKDVVDSVKKIEPDLVFLALGIPRQEKAIEYLMKDAKRGVFLGVGGTFDVLSGYSKRAPDFFLRFNLEWLYRILAEPKRLKRFANYNLNYIGLIIKMKFGYEK